MHEDLLAGLRTSFVDSAVESSEHLRAQLLVNEVRQGTSVLQALQEEFRACEQFSLSVAFVTNEGVQDLMMTLDELRARGVRGRILTTDYLCFTDPFALQRLQAFENIEIRMFRTGEAPAGAGGFHTKGYIFRRGGELRFIVGSSNLTGAALKSSREWNVRLVARDAGEMSARVMREFEALWESPCAHPLGDVLEAYCEEYRRQFQARREIMRVADGALAPAAGVLRPNSMQRRLVDNLLHLLAKTCEDSARGCRGLLISATGTGKTYASAFAVQAAAPRCVLFLVHREQIARKAAQSYRRVLGEDYRYGFLISQDRSALDIDPGDRAVVFSTMQTMVRRLDDFARNHFDVIVIDEVHRAGAASYKRIMERFTPQLWLGMTATPDRPDEENIYALFDHQILMELRLQQALEEDLLCPFHYFGITEFVSDELGPGELADFRRLTSEARVDHILRTVRLYAYSGTRVKGLMFCGSNAEARRLSEMLNARGLSTAALSGESSQAEREAAIERLTDDDAPEPLDYILTVDIFNEGVDIPEVNQVVLLRQTQSPIVFVQQLGRGLRKAEGKDFLVVIDFIGNYANNYMIPAALSGDRSYNKDTLRRMTTQSLISGRSTVHFDEISRRRIYEAIDKARTNSMQELRKAYQLLKYQIGRVPALMDFEAHGSIDAAKFFSFAPNASYVEFLLKAEKDAPPEVRPAGRRMLSYLCAQVGRGQRVSELLVLESMLAGERDNLREVLIRRLEREFSIKASDLHLQSVANVLTNNFARNADERKRNEGCEFLSVSADGRLWRPSAQLLEELAHGGDFRRHLGELVEFALGRNRTEYGERYADTDLQLYARYTYNDVCRLLNWPGNMPANNIGGYRYDAATRTLPVFINYDKDEDAIKYHDRFVSPQSLIALSKTGRRGDSSDADHIYKRTEADRGNRIYLFVRKNKNDQEAKSFYFLGEVEARGAPQTIELEGGTPAFEIDYRLRTPVRPDIYSYIVSES